MPMSGVMREILDDEEECRSTRAEEVFFSVARTMPFVAGVRMNELLLWFEHVARWIMIACSAQTTIRISTHL